MALYEWNNTLAVNIPEIDNQHKQLFKLINILHEAMTAGKGKEVLGKTLSDLVDYTKLHFSTEEKLLSLYRYPLLTTHKYEHDMLTKQVIALYEDYQSGKTHISIQVMNFLSDWLKNHIKLNDMKYIPYVNPAMQK